MHFDVIKEIRIEGKLQHRAVGAVVRIGGTEVQIWSFYGSDRDEQVSAQLLSDIIVQSSKALPS